MPTFLPRLGELAARFRRLSRYGEMPDDAEGFFRVLRSEDRPSAKAARVARQRRVGKGVRTVVDSGTALPTAGQGRVAIP